MEPGVRYDAVSVHPTTYHIYESGSPVGWVDYRLLGVRLEGSGCGSLPRDDRPLTAFPSICFFSPIGEVATYLDRALTEQNLHGLKDGILQVVGVKFENSLLIAVGHAMSFYVAREDGALTGACDDVPRGGQMTADADMWSEPDGQNSDIIGTVSAERRVYVQPGQVQGPGIGTDAGEITWFQVMSIGQEKPVGWVPAALVEFN